MERDRKRQRETERERKRDRQTDRKRQRERDLNVLIVVNLQYNIDAYHFTGEKCLLFYILQIYHISTLLHINPIPKITSQMCTVEM